MRRLPLVTLVVVAAWTVGGLVVDQQVGHAGQLALGVFTAGVLAALLVFQPATVRLQTLAVVGIATVGEIVGSIIWGVYDYRLENLPAFVPPGHGLVYLAGLSLATLLAQRTNALLVAAGVVAATWGIAESRCSRRRTSRARSAARFSSRVLVWTRRPVYAGVFLVVVALEIYGTALGTWTWQPAVPGLGLSQGNPPSGVASGYVVFDVLALDARRPARRRRRRASVEERAEIRRVDDRAGADQLPRRVDLVPDVPEQEPARLAVAVDVGDDALPVRLDPLSDGIELGVDIPDRLVAEVEEVGVEEGEVLVRLTGAGHVGADDSAVSVRVILVLDPARPAEGGSRKAGDVSGGEHVVASAGTSVLVHEDAVVDVEAGRLREVGRRHDAEPRDDDVSFDVVRSSTWSPCPTRSPRPSSSGRTVTPFSR